jgi:hypothetical protein
VSVRLPVDRLGGGVDGGVEGDGLDGGVEGGDDNGGVVTTGVGACNKTASEELLIKFNADREPGDEEAELLPAEATE